MANRLVERKKFNCVVRPDKVIEAKFDLNPKQSDLIDYVLLQIQDDDNVTYELKVIDMAKYYIDGVSNIYRDIEQVAKSMHNKGFIVLNPANPRDETYFAWFSMIRYVPNEGKIIYNIDKDLKKLLIQAKRGIMYNPKYSIGLGSKYSKRMYYFLKLYQDTKIRIDNYNEFLEKMECPERYFKNAYDFKVRVMDVAQKEIEENTDIKFTYNIKKDRSGKRTITMKIYPNERILTRTEDMPSEVIELFMDVAEVSVADIKTMWVESDLDYEKLKEVTYAVLEKPYTNFVGYVISALRNDLWGKENQG